MKIPAQILSPVASSNKGAHNAPVKSVADLLSKEPGGSRDFFSALKSLQSLAKPQKENDQPAHQGKDSASLRSNTVATKVAELKVAEAKFEKSELTTPDLEASYDLVQSDNGQTNEGKELKSEIKVTIAENARAIDKNPTGVEFVTKESDTGQLPVKIGAVQPQSEKTDRHDVSLAGTGGSRPPVESSSLAVIASDQRTTKAAIAPPVERKPIQTGPAMPNNKAGTDAAGVVAHQQRSVIPNDENSRRQEGSRPQIDRLLKSETILTGQASMQQGFATANKAEAKMEAQRQNNLMQAEMSHEPKPTLENTTQFQVKGATMSQANAANSAIMQPAPAVAAKEVSAQVTRHLNSELLNMELRTQVVSERATTGALNSSILTLQLQPVGLGRVQAEIRKEGELVRIKLTVEAKGTFEILKNDIDVLKAAMRALGTAEGDVTLTQGNISRLPNEGANSGQSLFSNERDNRSELQGRQNQDPSGHSRQQTGGEDSASLVNASDPAMQIAGNTVTI